METSVSLLGRLGGTPTDDDWRLLDELYRPLLRAWMARARVPASDVDDLVRDVLSVVVRRIAGFEWRGQGRSEPGCGRSWPTGCATISAGRK
jgi:hypothetical protein